MDTVHGNIKFLSVTQKDFGSDAGRYEQISQARSFLAGRMHAQRRASASTGPFDNYGRKSRQRGAQARHPKGGNIETEFVLTELHHEPSDATATFPTGISADLSFQDLADIFQPSCKDTCGNPSSLTRTLPDEHHVGSLRRHLPCLHDNGVELQCEEQRQMIAKLTSFRCPLTCSTSTEQSTGAQPGTRQHNRTALCNHNLAPMCNTATIAEVQSTLDPFIHLPIETSREEQTLIHFYLNFGRRWLLGTSTHPRHCPALELARSQMEKSPIYVLSRVVIGELILSRMCQRPLRKCYYLRCADMYKTANKMLFDDCATPCDKLYMLIQLSMVEHLARRIHLKAMHLKAIEHLVESQGGIATMLAHRDSGDLQSILMRFYPNQFVRTEVSIEGYSRFAALKLDLMNIMGLLQVRIPWYHHHPFFNQRDEFDGCTTAQWELRPLINYLSNLLLKWRQCESTTTSLPEDMGVLFCSYSLAMTFIEHQPLPQEGFEFLVLVQRCMVESTPLSTQSGRELDNLHPVAVADIISRTRCEMFPSQGDWKELRIAQASVDFHKLCCLLKSGEKIVMIEWILGSVLPMSLMQQNLTAQNGSYLKLLDESLERAWWTTAPPEDA